ncbi:MAG: class I SAM-dependent methyltransferase, partial [Catenulispora sp.]|nr:class I SAM-dependent methyltransferase [Catenulispora sp.]
MTLSAATMPHNLRLIGGEMLVWTDNEPQRERIPTGSGALEELLRGLARPGGRVLVAGPHSAGVIDLLDRADMQITCLLRAYPDAAELAARHPNVQVLCGS